VRQGGSASAEAFLFRRYRPPKLGVANSMLIVLTALDKRNQAISTANVSRSNQITAAKDKSFLVLFFKKELLSSYCPSRCKIAGTCTWSPL
jgi:hypothetical protein